MRAQLDYCRNGDVPCDSKPFAEAILQKLNVYGRRPGMLPYREVTAACEDIRFQYERAGSDIFSELCDFE